MKQGSAGICRHDGGDSCIMRAPFAGRASPVCARGSTGEGTQPSLAPLLQTDRSSAFRNLRSNLRKAHASTRSPFARRKPYGITNGLLTKLGLSPTFCAPPGTGLRRADAHPAARPFRRARRSRPARGRQDRHRQDRSLRLPLVAASLPEEQPNPARFAPTPRLAGVVPTRELAAQVGQSFEDFGRHLRQRTILIFGGVSPRAAERRAAPKAWTSSSPRRPPARHINSASWDSDQVRHLCSTKRDACSTWASSATSARCCRAAAESAEPAVLGDVLRGDPRARQRPAARSAHDRGRAAQRPCELVEHREMHLWSRATSCRRAESPAARGRHAADARLHAHQAWGQPPRRPAREDGIQVAATPRTNKSQTPRHQGPRDFKDYKVQVAGCDRHRSPWPRHHRAAAGGELRVPHVPETTCTHRPHWPARCRRARRCHWCRATRRQAAPPSSGRCSAARSTSWPLDRSGHPLFRRSVRIPAQAATHASRRCAPAACAAAARTRGRGRAANGRRGGRGRGL